MEDSSRQEQQPLLRSAAGTESASGHDEEYSRQTGTTPPSTFKKSLGTIEAFGIAIAIIIGSGIFTSAGAIDTNVPSPGIALVIWLVGGVLAWTGATTFAELGTAIPGEGGVQPWLQRVYGDTVGFLSAWTWIVGNQPSAMATLSIVFVESAYSAAGITDQASHISHKLLSILVLVSISVANSISTKASTRLNSFFVVVKFMGVFAVVIAGLAVVGMHIAQPEKVVGGGDWAEKSWFEYRNSLNPDGTETDWSMIGQWQMFGHLAAALYAALWAYSGWDKAIYVSAELSEPARQLPIAINSALPIVIVCFLLASSAYYILLPWKVVSTTDSIAVTAITNLIGKGFGIAMAVVICVVVAGSLLGNSLVVTRMTVAAANRRWIPDLFTVVGRVGLNSKKRDHNDTLPSRKMSSDAPINAVILSVILTSLFILVGDFRSLIIMNGMGEYTFFFLTVLGSLILRWREPTLHRPYKPLILFPIIFVLVSGFVVVASFVPSQAMLWITIWVTGIIFRRMKRRYFETERVDSER